MNARVHKQKHILVVDDEPLVGQSIQLLLEADCIVEYARDAAEAMAIFEPGKFDMVFTDYIMPQVKGDKLAAAIKRRAPGQPIVMITAFPEKLQSSACPLGGVDSFICKPFDADALRTAITRYVPA